jgi:hypothetical protein
MSYNAEQYKLGNILKLEQMQIAREMFVDFDNFCTYFLSNVIGKQAYNKRVHQETISCITTVSDEAFVVLCLENSMKRWEHEAANPTEKRIEAVYTASPAEASKYGGWSIEGMRRFNILQRDIIPKSRRSSQKLEENYLLHKKGINQPCKKTKKAKLPGNEEDMPWSVFMHDDDNDPISGTNGDWTSDQEELDLAQQGKVSL